MVFAEEPKNIEGNFIIDYRRPDGNFGILGKGGVCVFSSGETRFAFTVEFGGKKGGGILLFDVSLLR
jgi:hypothetical protein